MFLVRYMECDSYIFRVGFFYFIFYFAFIAFGSQKSSKMCIIVSLTIVFYLLHLLHFTSCKSPTIFNFTFGFHNHTKQDAQQEFLLNDSLSFSLLWKSFKISLRSTGSADLFIVVVTHPSSALCSHLESYTYKWASNVAMMFGAKCTLAHVFLCSYSLSVQDPCLVWI